MAPKTLPHLFQSHAYGQAERPFLYGHDPEEGWVSQTWDDLALQVHRLGLGFLSESVSVGDRVGIWAQNSPQWVSVDLALLSIGAITIPIPVTASQGEVKELVQSHKLRVLIVESWSEWELVRSWQKQCPSLRSVVVLSSAQPAPRVDINVLSFDELRQSGMSQSPQAFFDRVGSLTPSHQAVYFGLDPVITHQELLDRVTTMAQSLSLQSGDLHLSQIPLSNPLERLGLYTLLYLGGRIAYASTATSLFNHMKELEPSLTIALPDHLQKLKWELENTVKDRNLIARHFFKRITSNPATSGFSRSLKNRFILAPTRQHLGKNFRLILCEPARLPGEDVFFFENLGVTIERRDPLLTT